MADVEKSTSPPHYHPDEATLAEIFDRCLASVAGVRGSTLPSLEIYLDAPAAYYTRPAGDMAGEGEGKDGEEQEETPEEVKERRRADRQRRKEEREKWVSLRAEFAKAERQRAEEKRRAERGGQGGGNRARGGEGVEPWPATPAMQAHGTEAAGATDTAAVATAAAGAGAATLAAAMAAGAPVTASVATNPSVPHSGPFPPPGSADVAAYLAAMDDSVINLVAGADAYLSPGEDGLYDIMDDHTWSVSGIDLPACVFNSRNFGSNSHSNRYADSSGSTGSSNGSGKRLSYSPQVASQVGGTSVTKSFQEEMAEMMLELGGGNAGLGAQSFQEEMAEMMQELGGGNAGLGAPVTTARARRGGRKDAGSHPPATVESSNTSAPRGRAYPDGAAREATRRSQSDGAGVC